MQPNDTKEAMAKLTHLSPNTGDERSHATGILQHFASRSEHRMAVRERRWPSEQAELLHLSEAVTDTPPEPVGSQVIHLAARPGRTSSTDPPPRPVSFASDCGQGRSPAIRRPPRPGPGSALGPVAGLLDQHHERRLAITSPGGRHRPAPSGTIPWVNEWVMSATTILN